MFIRVYPRFYLTLRGGFFQHLFQGYVVDLAGS